jgi:hypothetical protein
MRALERSRQSAHGDAIAGRMEGCMTLSGSVCIRHCPWCGVTLTEHYHQGWEKLLDPEIADEFGWSEV